MNVAIIAAAGKGTRMGGPRAKQFLELLGKPLILHTLEPFEQCDAIHEIILVLPAGDAAGFLSLASEYSLRKLSRVVPGGATRAESVFRGLSAARSATTEIVAVHDGARPFVTAVEINQVVDSANVHGAAILVGPATDTIKQVSNGLVEKTIDRRELRRALTPQCFRFSLLRRAYDRVDLLDPELTDDSLLVERLGEKVAIVEGASRNIKITQPQDLILAEALLKETREQ